MNYEIEIYGIMILSFEIENVLSYGQAQKLSFEATKERKYRDYYITRIGKYKVLKLALLFGPNASGKTNLLVALDFLRELALQQPKNKDEEIDIVKFEFDDSLRKKPARLKLEFFVDQQLFVYEVKLDKKVVYYERLSFYPSREALVYERVYNQQTGLVEVTFGSYSKLKRFEQQVLTANTLPNGTVLAAYRAINVKSEQLDKVTAFFKEKLFPVAGPVTSLYEWAKREMDKDSGLLKFLINMLPKADFNIRDLKLKKSEEELSDEFIGLVRALIKNKDQSVEQLELPKKSVDFELIFQHWVNGRMFELKEELESRGTHRFIGLFTVLYKLLRGNAVLPVDELEASLHYELQVELLRYFLENSIDSQLIATTHNICLLSEDFLRRDVIWLTEKDDTGQTKLYRTSDFDFHSNLSLLNLYRSKSLGGYPAIVL